MTSITALMRASEARAKRESQATAAIRALTTPLVPCALCCHEMGKPIPALAGVCDAHRRSAGDDTLRGMLIAALDEMTTEDEGAA